MAGPGRARRGSRTLVRDRFDFTIWKIVLTYRIMTRRVCDRSLQTVMPTILGPLPARVRLSFNPARPLRLPFGR
jgi:hypothetical protein